VPSAPFDPIARWYDQTRSLPAEIATGLTRHLATRYPPGRYPRVLELGVGTGRIGGPLARAGYEVVGVDLSSRMLDRLRANLAAEPGLAVFPVRATATRLPFRAGSFDVVSWTHVLHLVPRWRAALREALRVVRPGGLLIDLRTTGGPHLRRLSKEYERRARVHGWRSRTRGVRNRPPIARYLDRAGARALPRSPRWEWSEAVTARSALRFLGLRIYSRMRTFPLAGHRAVMHELRPWAARTYGDLDVPHPVRGRADYMVFRAPSTVRPSRSRGPLGRRGRRTGG
jgi:ubiquinone/menaquinone biosynthesis C-methylase UbiE